MSFLDDVKNVYKENYIKPIDMNEVIEGAYQELLEEISSRIKKEIIEKVAEVAKEGNTDIEIKFLYDWKQK